MELELKQPKDKPPCICIVFESTLEAEKLNYSWLEHKDYLFNIVFEIEERKLDIILKQDELGLRHRYKNVTFFPDKLFRFLYNNKGAKQYSFCHIYSYYDKHIVASRHNGKGKTYWVLPIDNIQVKKEQ